MRVVSSFHISRMSRMTLLAAAFLGAGWWLRGLALPAVHAQRTGEDSGLAFQLSGIGPETALTVWNASNRTLYVYQGAVAGSSNVNCSFSFQIERPGAPIQRHNCPIGSLFPAR